MGFKTCGPNAALVKTGLGVNKPKIVAGGFVYVWPCTQRVRLFPLSFGCFAVCLFLFSFERPAPSPRLFGRLR